MSTFESGAQPEKNPLKEKIRKVVEKMRAEGYEFDTTENGSEFFVKLREKNIGFTKIPGVETENGYLSLEEMVERAIRKNAPRKESPPETTLPSANK
mgnify:CR=1 FL=1